MTLFLIMLVVLITNFWFSEALAFWPDIILGWLGSLGLFSLLAIVLVFIAWCFGE